MTALQLQDGQSRNNMSEGGSSSGSHATLLSTLIEQNAKRIEQNTQLLENQREIRFLLKHERKDKRQVIGVVLVIMKKMQKDLQMVEQLFPLLAQYESNDLISKEIELDAEEDGDLDTTHEA
ncbi:unnamed protein product [Linum trigynum]|uniref:Uncharacterized protein n=1 Tax=Linum trigynum TaxID=586398 RepID=A0AAV2ER21_9ROSI